MKTCIDSSNTSKTTGDRLKCILEGLGFEVLAQFEEYDGFDGIVLGHKKHSYHLEFTPNH